jgi:hypothetical protein
MTRQLSAAYIDLLTQGPFPGQLDYWAEAGRYFQQIHSGMIEDLLRQLRLPLLEMGYLIGKETSLQVIEGAQPDLFLREQSMINTVPKPGWDYAAAAEALAVEAGVLTSMPELFALAIRDHYDHTLVTILEIVSPSNKVDAAIIEVYRARRQRIVLQGGVNVVELDLTRSLKHLFAHALTQASAYHIAIFLPNEAPRVLLMSVDEAVKRFALPLRAAAVVTDPHTAYLHAYHDATIAGHILREDQYTPEALPFPSTLSKAQREEALAAVARWKAALEQAQAQNGH